MRNGEEYRLLSLGPEISGNEYLDLLNKIQGFSAVEAALVCGSVCGGMEPIHSYDRILSAFKDNNEQCATFLDTGEKHTAAALAGKQPPDFIKPNILEFHRLLRVKVNVEGIAPAGTDPATVGEKALIERYCEPHDGLPAAWQVLIRGMRDFAIAYPRVHVLLSVSRLGALILQGDSVLHSFYCGDVKINTLVGAGDSFLGGYVTSYISPHDRHKLKEALCAGVAASVARLQGMHRDFGYIDQEKLQEVSASKELAVEEFKIESTQKYVRNKLMTCFQSKKK